MRREELRSKIEDDREGLSTRGDVSSRGVSGVVLMVVEVEVVMVVSVEMEAHGVVGVAVVERRRRRRVRVVGREDGLPSVRVPISVVCVSVLVDVMVVISGRRVGGCWDEEELRVGVEGA